jgi:hypothetical protein
VPVVRVPSQRRGVLDLVADGENGRLYTPGSAEQLRHAVVAWQQRVPRAVR